MAYRLPIAFFLSLLLVCASRAAGPVSEAHLHQEEVGLIKYRLIKPSSIEKEKRYPLIVHLHGAGERGDDNAKQLAHFFAPGKALAKVDDAKQPYFAFVPQCPNGEQWVNVPWKDGSYELKKISDALDLALRAMDQIIKDNPIDTSRIYITGLSMGGYGTWDAILRRPDFFAAAVPICGAGDPSKAKLIAKLPIWVWHGDADTAVPVKGSRDMIEAIKNAGGNAKYSELEKVGHNSWDAAYDSSEMWQWMFEQKREVKE